MLIYIHRKQRNHDRRKNYKIKEGLIMKDFDMFDCSADFDMTNICPNRSFSSAKGSLSPVSFNIDLTQVFSTIANGYRDIAINQEEQRTKREYIRQMATVELKKIEANTEQYMTSLYYNHQAKMSIIRDISYIITKKDIDAEVVKLVEVLLNYLQSDR